MGILSIVTGHKKTPHKAGFLSRLINKLIKLDRYQQR